jgi:hypothetical protein
VKMTQTKKVLIFIGSLWAIAVVTNATHGYYSHEHTDQAPATTMADRQSQPLLNEPPRGTYRITIHDDQDWSKAAGVFTRDSSKRVEATLITKGVWWQIIYDEDTSHVHDLHPADWTGGKTNFEGPPSSITRWRIRPGQGIHEGTIMCVITDRK